MTYTRSLWTTVAALIGFGLAAVIILIQRQVAVAEPVEATTGELLSSQTTCAIQYHDTGRWKQDHLSDEMPCETVHNAMLTMAFNQGPGVIHIDRLAFKYWSRLDGRFHDGHDIRIGQLDLHLPPHAKIKVLLHPRSGRATFAGLAND